MCVVQETRNGVVLTLGSYGERCECDNSTSGACPVGTDLKLVCGKTQIIQLVMRRLSFCSWTVCWISYIATLPQSRDILM